MSLDRVPSFSNAPGPTLTALLRGMADIYCGRTGCLCSLDLIQSAETYLGTAFLAARYLLNFLAAIPSAIDGMRSRFGLHAEVVQCAGAERAGYRFFPAPRHCPLLELTPLPTL